MGQLAIQLPPAILARLTVITLARAAACRLRHRQRGHAISRIRFTSKGKPPQGPSSVRGIWLMEWRRPGGSGLEPVSDAGFGHEVTGVPGFLFELAA